MIPINVSHRILGVRRWEEAYRALPPLYYRQGSHSSERRSVRAEVAQQTQAEVEDDGTPRLLSQAVWSDSGWEKESSGNPIWKKKVMK